MSNELRPKTFEDIIGQIPVVNKICISLSSAKLRNDVLGHTLLSGEPGLGKTTIALAIANDVGSKLFTANGGNVKQAKDIIPMLMKVKEQDILFIDEIHRLPTTVEEFLYTCMEDYRMDVGGDSKFSIELPKFTLIGATTLSGALSKPMLDRFIYKHTLKPYNSKELSQIISAGCDKVGLALTDDMILKIAKMSRGTPRKALSILLWVRDYFEAKQVGITNEEFDVSIMMSGIDENGYTEEDIKYLSYLKSTMSPVGLKSISDAIGIDEKTILHTIEPFLIKRGKIKRTTKGRIIL